MKKILSVTLAIIMLLSVMMVAIPAAAATPIEAIPYSNWSINGEHFGNMQKTLINTLGFTTTQGVLIEPWDTSATLSVESNKIVSSTVGATIKYDTETAPSIDGVNSVIMYVKTDSANTLLPVIAVTNRGNISWVKWDVEMSLAFGSTYYYAALGDTEWTEATAGASGHSNEAQQVRWGTVSFDSAFEGYIKIPLTSLSSDTYTSGVISTDTVAHIWTRFQYGGVGYGSCAFGPVFFVTKDSTSTKINVPNEYKTAPIEATPVTGGTRVNYNSSYVSVSDVTPVEKLTTATGIKITPANGALSYEATGLYHSKAIANYLFKEAPNAETGTYYTLPDTFLSNGVFMLYVKTNTANAILPTIHFGKASGSYNLTYSLGVKKTYSYAAIDDDVWTEETVQFTGLGAASTRTDYGVIQFDSAFEGFIKIPVSSLIAPEGGAINAIGRIEVKFANVGGEAGDVVAGPYFFVTEDSTSTKINVPEEYKPGPIEATPITGGTVWNNFSGYVSPAKVMPLEKLTTAEGVKLSLAASEPIVNADNAVAGSKAIMQMHFGDYNSDTLYALPDDFKTNGQLIVYVKTESANKLYLALQVKGSWSYLETNTLKLNSTYEYAALGAEEWTTATVDTVGSSSGTTNGLIEFDSAFEGYVKIPATSFSWTGTVNLGRIEAKFQNIGGDYGTVTVGPFFYVTADSSSTKINVPEEYKPAPIDVKNIEMGYVGSRLYNFSNEKVDNGYNLYIDSDVFGDSDSAWADGAETWTYVENAYTGSSADANLIMKPAIPLAAKDVNGFLVYLKTETANEFALTIEYEKGTHWNKSWNPTISLKPGKTVKVLATGSDDWQEMTIEKGGVYNNGGEATLVFGKVCFDSAFEGYIKIPFDSFGNDSNWAPYTTTEQGAIDRIIAFQPAFKGIGSSLYGEELVTDIVGFFTEDSPLTTYEVSEAVYETGDINNDCFVNVNDLTQLKKYLLGLAAEASVKYANVNGDTDGAVDILDLIRLKKTLAGA